MLKKNGLYDPFFEHDSCGVGFVVRIDGTRSHEIVEDGIQVLCNLVHRGAVGGDLKTGDGAGMILQSPHQFFKKVVDFDLLEEGSYGVGMLFLPKGERECTKARKLIEEVVAKEKGEILGWRKVPTEPDCLGQMAREGKPSIWQVFLRFGEMKGDLLDRKLYVLRKIIEKEARKVGWDIYSFYIPFDIRTC